MRTFLILVAALIAMIGSPTLMAQSIVNDGPATYDVRDHALAIVDYRPLSARVLGGGNAEPGAYPSIVALVKPGFRSLDQRLFCGGTVVHERWVLTAAHCVHDVFYQPLQPREIRVVAGIHDLALDEPDEEIPIVRVVIHPDYDSSMDLPPNDIALLELQTPVSVAIAPLFNGDSNDYVGAVGAIAGWGAIDYTDEANPVYPTVLQDATVPVISDELCNAPQSYDGLIVRSHLCAGFVDGKVDACVGDSGGPLYLNIDGVQVQAAITSFGIGCGLPLFYGIYTDVSYFIPWLSDYIAVPEQTPTLLAERANEGELSLTGGSAGEVRKSSGGALGWVGVLVLLMLRLRRFYR